MYSKFALTQKPRGSCFFPMKAGTVAELWLDSLVQEANQWVSAVWVGLLVLAHVGTKWRRHSSLPKGRLAAAAI